MTLKNKGFTLVELVIVIIVLGTLGVATTSYISTGVTIYTDISERDRELNSVRFAMERLRRDILKALPNSLIVSADQQCLTFTPIIASTLYGYDFPISPISASSATIAKITPFDGNTIAAGDRAVVYLLDSDELNPASGTSPAKEHPILSVVDEAINFSGNVSFTLSSPSKRLYIIRESKSYYFENDQLFLGSGSGCDGGSLMANDIEGEFSVSDATLQRNGLAMVTFILDFDGVEVPIEQTLHVNNVP